jgi:hypothetical protein
MLCKAEKIGAKPRYPRTSSLMYLASSLMKKLGWRSYCKFIFATFLFLYITVLTVMGVNRSHSKCVSVGIQEIAWAFGGMIFALVYCTAGISGHSLFFTSLFFLCINDIDTGYDTNMSTPIII